MVRKTPEIDPNQPSMFIEHPAGNGQTDAHNYKYKPILEPAPEGVLPSEQPMVQSREISDPDFVKMVHEGVKTDNRRRAQLGKHGLPRKSDGTYDIATIVDNPGEMKGKFVNGRPIRGAADIADILPELEAKNKQMLDRKSRY